MRIEGSTLPAKGNVPDWVIIAFKKRDLVERIEGM
jgi:hypothetical protein